MRHEIQFIKDGKEYCATADVTSRSYIYGADADGNRGEKRWDVEVEDLKLELYDEAADEWNPLEWSEETKGLYKTAEEEIINMHFNDN